MSTEAALDLLRFEDVSRTYHGPAGRFDGLKNVSLSIRPGDYVSVTGPSGSGKSTFLNLAALLDRPSGGTLRYAGRDAASLTEPEACAIRSGQLGFVFQNFHLLAHRSVLDNVRLRFRYAGVGREEAEALSLEALRFVGLSRLSHKPARLLSGGEMQRVAIARAIALKPVLLAADEPTGNLDSDAAQGVLECFRQLHQQGVTLLLVTHNTALTRDCTRHLQCRDGDIREAA